MVQILKASHFKYGKWSIVKKVKIFSKNRKPKFIGCLKIMVNKNYRFLFSHQHFEGVGFEVKISILLKGVFYWSANDEH